MSASPRDHALIRAARDLARAVDRLRFDHPVSHVYNPLDYAWAAHEAYLNTYGNGRKRIVFLGMNPGPFGMAQTGVPFGEVDAVRNWMGLSAPVRKPKHEHPKRPVTGFDCQRSEVSGRRLWGVFAERFGSATTFFKEHFVVNYCPLVFMEETGRNLTPDKIPLAQREKLLTICDEHLRQVIAASQPEWLVGVGDFALKRVLKVFPSSTFRVGRIAHPSPASPAANKDWVGLITRQLRDLGIW